eukprot:4925567-Amphidinium_carterae.1
MILTATSNTYNFEQLRLALEIQFPVHPPADRARPQQAPGGKGGKGQPKRVNITDTGEPATAGEGAEAPATSDPNAGPPTAESEEAALAEVAEVLSVTAQKLRSFTQARGWVRPDKGKGKSKDKGKQQSKHAGSSSSHGHGQPFRPSSSSTTPPSHSRPTAPMPPHAAPPPPRAAPIGTQRAPMHTHVAESLEP